MNERIRELYRQAHTIRSWDGDPMREGNPPTVYWQDEVSAEKFAELIVQKCISQIAMIAVSNYENEDISWAADIAIKNIKDHFGMLDKKEKCCNGNCNQGRDCPFRKT